MFAIRRDWRYRSFFSLKLNPGGKLLEVGCGSGMFLRLAAAQGYRITGIDSDPSAVQTACELYRVTNVQALSIEDLLANPRDLCFDVICLFDVLEHLEDPVNVVQGLGKMLVPGGHVVCTVPGHQRWPQWFAPEVDLPPHHLTLWTRSALEWCFKNAGLNLVAIIRSPLLGDNLLHQASIRWKALQRLDVVGMALRATGHFVVMPLIARLLSVIPKAGGFTLLGVACKTSGRQLP
nr:class I SAM-dependent methyltransferase [Chloroflexota bacterium]